mgnify:CR=1 FL=1
MNFIDDYSIFFSFFLFKVVSIATYCAVIVPRAQLLAEAVTQGMFMASLYQLFCLFVAYCGGEAELITNAKPKSLNMKVPPCCCYPCCKLPQLTVNKCVTYDYFLCFKLWKIPKKKRKKLKKKFNYRKHMMLLRLSVLQLPVVQGLLYMVLLVMWANEEVRHQPPPPPSPLIPVLKIINYNKISNFFLEFI